MHKLHSHRYLFMKQLLIFIALIGICSTSNANGRHKKLMADTTITFNWKEAGVSYELKISLIGDAGHEGVIPGQGIASYIHIEKSQITSKQKNVSLEFKDTCNAQVSQLLFYHDNIAQRIINNTSREFFLFYEFASDGFDPRVIKYMVVGKNRMVSSEIHLLYNEEKMTYEASTSLSEFLSSLPPKYKAHARQDYNNVLRSIR